MRFPHCPAICSKYILRPLVTILLVAATLGLSLYAASASPAYATSIPINTLEDTTVPGDSKCTLREAVNNANTNSDTTSGDCVAGTTDDWLIFATGLAGTVTLSNGQITIDSDMHINVGGPYITIDANHSSRVFYITSGKTVTLERLTITGGLADIGGGIYNLGSLNLTGTGNAVTGNQATNNGGGIYNAGSMLFIDDYMIVSNNTALNGGGVYNESGLIVQGRVTDNTAANEGGGIYTAGSISIREGGVLANNTGTNGGVSTTAETRVSDLVETFRAIMRAEAVAAFITLAT